MEDKPPRKVFTVIIHDKPYDVYDIDGRKHEGYNDVPDEWWLYYSDRLPLGLIPPSDSEYFVPFSKGVDRRLWDIKITQRNTSKEKWGEIQFRSGTDVEMWCNKRVVYGFHTMGGAQGMAFAMAKVQYLQVMLEEHCFNFFEPLTENGRKIYWKGLPATVKVKCNNWEICIVPDYTTGLTKKEWWSELKNRESKIGQVDQEQKEMDDEDFDESMADDYINWGDALSDQHIDWFRKDDNE